MTKSNDTKLDTSDRGSNRHQVDEREIAHVRDILRDVEVGMLTTVADDARLDSRPMVLLDRSFTGRLLFLTDRRTSKAEDIASRPMVNASFVDPAGGRYLSLSGRAAIRPFEGDGARRAHAEFGRWLADDVTADDIAILRIDVERGEYWDESKSLMRRLGEWVGGMMQGVEHEPLPESEHAKVEFTGRRA